MISSLEENNGRYLVEIPATIVKLYSLKNGQKFKVKEQEIRKHFLRICYNTKLEE